MPRQLTRYRPARSAMSATPTVLPQSPTTTSRIATSGPTTMTLVRHHPGHLTARVDASAPGDAVLNSRICAPLPLRGTDKPLSPRRTQGSGRAAPPRTATPDGVGDRAYRHREQQAHGAVDEHRRNGLRVGTSGSDERTG